MAIKIIQNKVSGCCMWDGDPIYCQECRKETSTTYSLPTGKGVCRSCAVEFNKTYKPLPCSNCRCEPESLVSRDEGLLCHACNELLYGKVDPADLFDAAMKPWGGRLDLGPPKRDDELTPEELKARKLVQGMFSGYQICGTQPMCKPSGLIFAMKARYDKAKNEEIGKSLLFGEYDDGKRNQERDTGTAESDKHD